MSPRLRATCIFCATLLGALCVQVAHGKCKLVIVGELTVETANNRVVTTGSVNGQSISVLIDTGSGSSFVWESTARRLGIPMLQTLLRFYGVGGQAKSWLSVARHVQVGSFYASRLGVFVLGEPQGAIPQTHFVLGEAAFLPYSTEFDLAHGKLRLLRTDGCDPDQVSYWTDTFSLADMDIVNGRMEAPVVVNGRTITAILDTGAPNSSITRDAAERMGVAPWRTGIAPATKIGGLGTEREDTWVGTFATLTFGDESVKNVQLLISDLFRADRRTPTGSHPFRPVEALPSMLLGCDFFLAHRILTLTRQHKLVFTYNGGPIFASRPPPPDAAKQPDAATPSAPTPAGAH